MSLFKASFKNTFLMGLVRWAWAWLRVWAMMIAVFLLIPAYLLLTVPGALVAAVPGGDAYGITSIFGARVVALDCGGSWRSSPSSWWCSCPSVSWRSGQRVYIECLDAYLP
jgi:hypothetical protein